MTDSPLSESLAALSHYFVGGDTTLRDTLQRVADLARDGIDAADFVGLTMPIDGTAKTLVFTDPASPEIDRAQYDAGTGPCLDALRLNRSHLVEATEDDGRWPLFRRACIAHGVRSTLSLPLAIQDDVLGAMNLYSRTRRAFRVADRDAGLRFAAQAAVVLANSQAYTDAQQLGTRLGDAMDSRAVIEQAKGILMGAQRCTADEAFEMLIRASQRENHKLRDIAQRIVTNAPYQNDPTTPADNDV